MDIEKIKESAWIIYQLEIGLREFIIDTFDRFYNNDAWHEHDQNSNPLAPKMLVYIEEKKTSQKKSDLVNLNNLHQLSKLITPISNQINSKIRPEVIEVNEALKNLINYSRDTKIKEQNLKQITTLYTQTQKTILNII